MPSIQMDYRPHERALCGAAANGHAVVVRALVADTRVNVGVYGSLPLQLAAANGHLEVVLFFLDDPHVGPSAANWRALKLAISNGHASVCHAMLDHPRCALDTDATTRVLRCACKYGLLEIVQRLSSIPAVSTGEAMIPFAAAAACGHVGIMDCLLARLREYNLLGRSDVPPALAEALAGAVDAGHLPMVDRLLQEPGIDPLCGTRDGRQARLLATAAAQGHLAMAERLLMDPRAQRVVDFDSAIRGAVAGCLLPLVQQLLAHPRRATARQQHADALLTAMRYGADDIVACLAECAFRFPASAAELHSLLLTAAECGYSSVLDRALANERLGVWRNDTIEYEGVLSRALRCACAAGHLAAVERLLADPRTHACMRGRANSDLAAAAERRHADVVRRLLKVEGIACQLHSAPEHGPAALALATSAVPTSTGLDATPSADALADGDAGVPASIPFEAALNHLHFHAGASASCRLYRAPEGKPAGCITLSGSVTLRNFRAMQDIMADPCLGPVLLATSLAEARKLGQLHTQDAILNDPRLDQSDRLQEICEAAWEGRVGVLQIALPEARRRGVDPAAVGRKIATALRSLCSHRRINCSIATRHVL